MWKTGAKEKSVQKDSNKEEESGGSLVNEQVISKEEQQQNEEEESTEVSGVDYNDNDCEENDTEMEETAVKASTDTSGGERAQEKSVQENTCETVCIFSEEVSIVAAAAFMAHAKR